MLPCRCISLLGLLLATGCLGPAPIDLAQLDDCDPGACAAGGGGGQDSDRPDAGGAGGGDAGGSGGTGGDSGYVIVGAGGEGGEGGSGGDLGGGGSGGDSGAGGDLGASGGSGGGSAGSAGSGGSGGALMPAVTDALRGVWTLTIEDPNEVLCTALISEAGLDVTCPGSSYDVEGNGCWRTSHTHIGGTWTDALDALIESVETYQGPCVEPEHVDNTELLVTMEAIKTAPSAAQGLWLAAGGSWTFTATDANGGAALMCIATFSPTWDYVGVNITCQGPWSAWEPPTIPGEEPVITDCEERMIITVDGTYLPTRFDLNYGGWEERRGDCSAAPPFEPMETTPFKLTKL